MDLALLLLTIGLCVAVLIGAAWLHFRQ